MCFHNFFFFIFTLLISAADAENWNGSAQITFSGTSTLHAGSGTVAAEPFKTTVVMSGGKPRRAASTVTVKVAEMNTDEPKRDQNLRQAMKISSHPLVTGKIDSDFNDIAASGSPPRLPVELTLLGKPQRVTATISNWKLASGKATFDLEFPVSLKASGITVPTVLLFIKVGDTVKVRASVTLIKD